MNTPVSFELAKLLKEKGFDLPVRNYYLLNEKGKILHEGFDDDYWGNNIIVNWNKEIVGIKPFRDFISAPTIAKVVMWLYEKHEIWISVEPPFPRRIVLWEYYVQNANERISLGQNSGYNAPIEAFEAAIKYTLENIIK